MSYARYAQRHNWTPWQVDNQMYAWLDPLLLDVEDLIEEVQRERSGGQTAQAGGQG